MKMSEMTIVINDIGREEEMILLILMKMASKVLTKKWQYSM